MFNNLPINVAKLSKKVTNPRVARALDNIGFLLSKYIPVGLPQDNLHQFIRTQVQLKNGMTIEVITKPPYLDLGIDVQTIDFEEESKNVQ